MTSWGSLIAHCLSHYSVILGLLKKLIDVRFILDCDTLRLILERLVVLSHHICWIEKISHWVNINLLECHLNFNILFMIFFRLNIPQKDLVKDVLNRSRNNTWVFCWILLWELCAHGKGLATSCLTVSKNADIITIHKALYQVLYLIIDFILGRSLAKNTIEIEELRLIFVRL